MYRFCAEMWTQNVQYIFLNGIQNNFNNAGELKRIQFRRKKDTRDRF